MKNIFKNGLTYMINVPTKHVNVFVNFNENIFKYITIILI